MIVTVCVQGGLTEKLLKWLKIPTGVRIALPSLDSTEREDEVRRRVGERDIQGLV